MTTTFVEKGRACLVVDEVGRVLVSGEGELPLFSCEDEQQLMQHVRSQCGLDLQGHVEHLLYHIDASAGVCVDIYVTRAPKDAHPEGGYLFVELGMRVLAACEQGGLPRAFWTQIVTAFASCWAESEG